jgi:predicted permease
MRTLLQDLRYSLRQLFQNPGFSLTALISLALGIGAATAVFSVLYSGLLHPYPYRGADNLVTPHIHDQQGGSSVVYLNGSQVRAIEQIPAIECVLATGYHTINLTGREVPENVSVVGVTGNTFSDLGIPAFLGRGILPSDVAEGHPPQSVAIISYEFWRRHYLSAPDILGRPLELDHQSYQIVGVAAPRFHWAYDGDIYLPLQLTQNSAANLLVYLRLKGGSSRAVADAELQPLIERFAAENPKRFPEYFKVSVEAMNSFTFRRVGGTLYLMLGAVMLLLVIGCANVSILLLARGTARQYELSVRSAMGASRGRIVRQLLTESILLAVAGTALGIVASYQILIGIRSLTPYTFTPEAAITINRPVLFFAVALAFATALLFGLWPALRLSRTRAAQISVAGPSRMTIALGTRRTHDLLIAAQIAMTLLLLAASGSAMRSFITMLHRPLGYDPHNVMSLQISVHDNRYTTWDVRTSYFQQLRDKVSEIPGVTSAAISIFSNPPRSGLDTSFKISGRPSTEPEKALLQLVSPDFFSTLHIPVLQGRIWNSIENQKAAHFAVVNRTLAHRYFPNGDALGRSVKLTPLEEPDMLAAPGTSDSWLTIVGVSDDALNDNLQNPIQPAIYVPFTFLVPDGVQILVRANVPPLSLLGSVRSQIAKIDPEQRITGRTEELTNWISNGPEWRQERLAAWVFPLFGLMAITLAAVGLFSVVAYTVAQRTNEFGIRMALGALPINLLRIVLASAARSVLLGVATGIGLTFALSNMLAHYANGNTHDAPLLIAAALVMILVALGASLIPARHASHIDPMAAVRHE